MLSSNSVIKHTNKARCLIKQDIGKKVQKVNPYINTNVIPNIPDCKFMNEIYLVENIIFCTYVCKMCSIPSTTFMCKKCSDLYYCEQTDAKFCFSKVEILNVEKYAKTIILRDSKKIKHIIDNCYFDGWIIIDDIKKMNHLNT